ncbi:MAG: O-antigen ligase family protein [Prolixibacteraceae bacterium]|nr:O-antigen ligase family protein [Burkholderiales bacterium]
MTPAANSQRRWGNLFLADNPAGEERSSRRARSKLSTLAGIALLGILWGVVVAVAELNALYLCISLIGCVFILLDFRIGVVLLIVLMPISRSYIFPHAMLGVTGLNPLNLLLIGTLGSYLLRELSEGTLKRFVPRPLFWLYIVPIVIAGALGARHVDDIARVFFMNELLDFKDAAGYIRDLVVKPLFMVLFALLMAAAVARSRNPEKFLIPALISIWTMGLMVIIFVLVSGVGIDVLGRSTSREFLTPLGMHANELGCMYAIAYALLLFTWAESKTAHFKLILIASMGLVVVALVLTFSRGAFLGFFVVNLLFLLWYRNAKTLVFLGVLSVAALFVLPGAVFDRITTGYGSGLDAISANRIGLLWIPLLPELLRSPVYGNGIGSMLWSDAMRRGAGASILMVTHPHNAYLQTLLDMGIAGLILLGAYFVHVWKKFRALSIDVAVSPELRGFYRGAAAGLVSFLIAGISGSSLTPVSEQVFLWLAIGMMYGQLAKRTEN